MKICKGCKKIEDKEIKKEFKKVAAVKAINKANMQTRPLVSKINAPISSIPVLQPKPNFKIDGSAQVESKKKINLLIIGGLLTLLILKK